MFRRLVAAAAALVLVASTPVRADYVIKDGAGATQTFGSQEVSGVKYPKHVNVDTTGAYVGGSAIPFFVQVTNFPSTQAVTVASLPLPAGAATSAAQATGNAALGSPTDAAWDGSASSASITAILKGLPRTAGSSGGSSGSVTSPGTSGTAAQAVQGVTNGVPLPTSPTQASALATGQVSVTATATQIVAARPGRRSVVILQEGNGSGGSGSLVRLGGSSVTTSTGVPLPGTAYVAFTIEGGAAVYGIVASGSQTVSYVEIY